MNRPLIERFLNWEETYSDPIPNTPKTSQSSLPKAKKGRGYFWESIYSSVEDAPCEEASLTHLTSSNSRIEGTTGYNNRIIDSAKGIPKIEDKSFVFCDFSKEYVNFTFKNCRFTKCNFNKGKWHSVKFTDCIFEQCNFSFSDFIGCIFRDCKFSLITVSSDHLVFEKTSISSTAFMNAIYTNTQSLPTGYTLEGQNHHLMHTKAKVAQSILQSTQDEADQDLFFEAYKEKSLRWLDWKIHRPKFLQKDDIHTGRPVKRNRFLAFFLSIPHRIEYYITLASGFLTNWGRSIMRPLIIMTCITAIAAAAYYICMITVYNRQEYTFMLAAQRAVDVSLVAGYTKYAPGAANIADIYGGWLSYMTTIHMLVGLFWYALIVPVIVRRVLR